MEEHVYGSGSPVSDRKQAPKTKEELLSFVEDSWQYLSKSRMGLETSWKENIHFFAGDQWVRYLPHARRFTKHSLDEWVPTPTTNLLSKHGDRILDIFTSGDILPIVDPASRDQSDIEAAKAATRVLHSEFKRLQSEEKLLLPAALWLMCAGNVFLYAGWNGRAGDKVRRPKTQITQVEQSDTVLECDNCGTTVPRITGLERCPDCNEVLREGQAYALDELGNQQYLDREEPVVNDAGQPEYDEFRVGNIEEDVISPLNFFPMPAKSFDRCRYCIEVDPMDVDQVKSLFGKKAKDVVAENLEYEDWPGVYGHALQFYFQPERERRRDHVLVKIFRHIPDRRWKKGLLIITANGHVLHEGALDSCDGKLPYTHIKYRDVPGNFWGQSLFRDLIPLQKRINSIDSHLIQNRKQMVSNQWLVPEGSAISHIDGRSGLVVRWSPSTSGGFKPERLPGVGVPAQVLNEREQMVRDMEEISGAREVLSGDIPPGPETGAAIEAIQEQAFRRFGPSIKMWRNGLSEHEHRKLLNVAKYWKEQRLVKVLGDNSEIESYYISKSSLTPAKDMTVRVGVGMDFSQAAKRAKVMQAAQMGLLGDIRQAEVRGRIMERLGIEGFDSEYTLDAKKARRYLEMMKNGQEVPPPLPVDNHAVQFAIYKDFMLTSEYENLPEPQQQAILQRSQIHQQVMQQEQQQAMMAAQAAKGAPDQAADAIAQTGAMGGAAPTQQ